RSPIAVLTRPPSPRSEGPAALPLFFERRSRSPLCAADRSGAHCRVSVYDSPRSADWPSTSARASAGPNLPGFQTCVPGATWSDAKNTGHGAEARRRSRRILSPHPLQPEPSVWTRPCRCAVSRELKPPDSGEALRARPQRHLIRNQMLPSHLQRAEQNRSSLPCRFSFPPCSLIAVTQDVSVMLAQRGARTRDHRIKRKVFPRRGSQRGVPSVKSCPQLFYSILFPSPRAAASVCSALRLLPCFVT